MLTSSISSRAFEIIVKAIYIIAGFEAFEQFNQWQIPVPRYAQQLLKKIFLCHDNWNLPMIEISIFVRIIYDYFLAVST